jgi:fatty acid/phospholipid biosynthesis enzyme
LLSYGSATELAVKVALGQTYNMVKSDIVSVIEKELNDKISKESK